MLGLGRQGASGTMAGTHPVLFFLLVLSCASLPCVAAADVLPLVISICVCTFMLIVIATMLIMGYIWKDLRNGWSRRNRKVKMPRSYFLKKEEAKRRLLNGSIASHALSPPHNGVLSNKDVDTASWVQEGHHKNPVVSEIYEQQDVTMELGDENEQEFKIETDIVDNEVLDVGPYKSSVLSSTAQPTSGSVYTEPYIYTTGDRASTIIKSQKVAGGTMASVYIPDNEQMSKSAEQLVKL